MRRQQLADPRRGTERKPAADVAGLTAQDHLQTLASISQEWSNGEEMGKVTTGSGGEEGHGEVSPLPREPARAARRRLKSPSLRRARPSSLATLISGVRVEPDGGAVFVAEPPDLDWLKCAKTLTR